MMQSSRMTTQQKSSASGITLRLPVALRQRVDKVARTEHRSAAAYLESLVERDLRERDEAERVVRIHVTIGLPDSPTGHVTRGADEDDEQYARRATVLDTLFGAH